MSAAGGGLMMKQKREAKSSKKRCEVESGARRHQGCVGGSNDGASTSR